MSGKTPRYLDADYLSCDPFADDSDRALVKFSLPLTRKPHHCNFCHKRKRKGTRMFCERGVIDGEFQSNYACLPCLERECTMRDWATKRGETPKHLPGLDMPQSEVDELLASLPHGS